MGVELATRKRRLREALALRRASLGEVEANLAGAAVARRLLALEVVRDADRVALYAALPGELPLIALFDGLEGRAECLLPRMRGRDLEFAPVARWEELRPGRHGVLEPPVDIAAVPLDRVAVVVVPGLAYDVEGNRLGRGGGYYDRALAGIRRGAPLCIGAAFEFQVVDAVPHDSRDRPVDAIVTDRALRWASPRTETE